MGDDDLPTVVTTSTYQSEIEDQSSNIKPDSDQKQDEENSSTGPEVTRIKFTHENTNEVENTVLQDQITTEIKIEKELISNGDINYQEELESINEVEDDDYPCQDQDCSDPIYVSNKDVTHFQSMVDEIFDKITGVKTQLMDGVVSFDQSLLLLSSVLEDQAKTLRLKLNSQGSSNKISYSLLH